MYQSDWVRRPGQRSSGMDLSLHVRPSKLENAREAIGDGKIFVSEVVAAIRIRDDTRGEAAL